MHHHSHITYPVVSTTVLHRATVLYSTTTETRRLASLQVFDGRYRETAQVINYFTACARRIGRAIDNRLVAGDRLSLRWRGPVSRVLSSGRLSGLELLVVVEETPGHPPLLPPRDRIDPSEEGQRTCPPLCLATASCQTRGMTWTHTGAGSGRRLASRILGKNKTSACRGALDNLALLCPSAENRRPPPRMHCRLAYASSSMERHGCANDVLLRTAGRCSSARADSSRPSRPSYPTSRGRSRK